MVLPDCLQLAVCRFIQGNIIPGRQMALALYVRSALGSTVNLYLLWQPERFTWTPPGTDTGRGEGHIWLADVSFFQASARRNSPNSSFSPHLTL